jgi:hypothetical protein
VLEEAMGAGCGGHDRANAQRIRTADPAGVG